jgi:hypothetical protein
MRRGRFEIAVRFNARKGLVSMRRLTITAVLIVLGLGVGAGAGAAQTGLTISARLSSANAIPKAGRGGAGSIVITLDSKKGQVCWKLNVSGIDKPLSAYVHRGVSGKTGPGVISLGPGFTRKGCELAPVKTLTPVIASPTGYYVNVYTKKYPAGAIRGQLHK